MRHIRHTVAHTTNGLGRTVSDTSSTELATKHTVSGNDAWYPAAQRDMYVVRQLVSKDFKLKYRRSVLGILWSVLNPLLMMAITAAVFSRMIRITDETITNFPIYLILGNTAFSLMSDATSSGMGSIIWASSLLKKVKINRWVFPVQKVLFAVTNYAFSMVAVALVMLFYGWIPTVYALYLPLGILYLTIFCVGLSLLLSSLAVFFRDVMHLWGVLLSAWTYLTPLFYPISILPEWLQTLERFNPMYLYVTFIRRILLWRTDPGLMLHLGCIAFALLSLGIGYLVFRKTESKFILYI